MAIAQTWPLAVAAGVVVLAVTVPPASGVASAQAAASIAFTIPAEDGYGIGDCMTTGSVCGQEIADAWCVTHGRTRAVAFGAADITGEIPREAASPGPSGTVVIRCE